MSADFESIKVGLTDTIAHAKGEKSGGEAAQSAPTMRVPEGFVLVPRGGRPPKHARDVAVFLMRHLMCIHEKQKAAEFERTAVEHFDLSDEAAVRKRVKAARTALRGRWVTVVVGKAVFTLPAPALTPTPGAKGWAWCHDFKEALRIEVTRSSVGYSFIQRTG